MSTEIRREGLAEVVNSVQQPDGVYNLRDVEKAAAARFGLTAAEAKKLVRAYDRATVISPKGIARLWSKAASADAEQT